MQDAFSENANVLNSSTSFGNASLQTESPFNLIATTFDVKAAREAKVFSGGSLIEC
ncbi:protein of unknown function [Methylocella tundrae]|uniref:Uncharacterized protein n=1 Tax=Methylocella tundrae TaxID=227605 RepID=A0A4U8Z5I3_METTU|nr:protein of unknown function [Methylocella tundrae]